MSGLTGDWNQLEIQLRNIMKITEDLISVKIKFRLQVTWFLIILLDVLKYKNGFTHVVLSGACAGLYMRKIFVKSSTILMQTSPAGESVG